MEIRKLLVHIDSGCQSGIVPGRGTNRNEKLHKDLNACITAGRYGVELAYALLTSILFNHNEMVAAQRGSRSLLPISAYSKCLSDMEVEILVYLQLL